MTATELIALLLELPPDAEVWMEQDAGIGRVGSVAVESGDPQPGVIIICPETP